MHLRTPSWIGQIDPERSADVGKLRMRPPRLDALQMRLVEVARPPYDLRTVAGEIDHVLSGAAAGLDDVAGFAIEKFPQHLPNRLMVAVKCRRIQTPISFDRLAIPAEFHHVFRHCCYPL